MVKKRVRGLVSVPALSPTDAASLCTPWTPLHDGQQASVQSEFIENGSNFLKLQAIK